MNTKLKSPEADLLFEALKLIETQEEFYNFFEDICTVSEFQSMALRLSIAKMLEDKKTYIEISELTKASTATISRINKCLVYGADGYKSVLKKMKER